MDVVQMALGLGLDGFRHRVQHVHGLVDPTPLFLGRGKYLAQGRPEAECTVASGQFGVLRQAAAFEIKKQLAPALGAFAEAVGHRQQLLAAVFVHCPAVHVHMHERGPRRSPEHIAFPQPFVA